MDAQPIYGVVSTSIANIMASVPSQSLRAFAVSFVALNLALPLFTSELLYRDTRSPRPPQRGGANNSFLQADFTDSSLP